MAAHSHIHPNRSPSSSDCSSEDFFLGSSEMLLHHIMKTAEMSSLYDGNSQNRSPAFQKSSKKKSTYKHIPHSEKPPQLVAKRNARERRRVQAVNGAFSKLRRHIPYENKNKRLSKVKTLKIAIDYIHHLQDMIEDFDASVGGSPHSARAPLATNSAGVEDNCRGSMSYLTQTQNSEVFGSPSWGIGQVSPSSAESGPSGPGEPCYRVQHQPLSASFLQWDAADINQDLCYQNSNPGDYGRTVLNQNLHMMHTHAL